MFGSISCNRAEVYIHQNFLKVVVHVIVIDQWNKNARLYKIQVTITYSHAIRIVLTGYL